MKIKQVEQEDARLSLLRGYGILDTAPDEDFDDLCALAAEICDVPIALISLVEDDRQWFKSRVGTDMDQTPIEMSMCAHAIAADDFLEIQDTAADPRTGENALVTGDEAIRFYAGALLKADNEPAIGTLCVLDHEPRQLTDFQRRSLRVLANQVMRQIELRCAVARAEILRKEVDHRVKNSLQAIESLIRLQSRQEPSESARNALETVQGRLQTVSSLHEALYLTDAGAAVGLAGFLERVVSASAKQMPPGVMIAHDISTVDVLSRDASSIGMIVNEAMANAGKYAFEGRTSGRFSVTGHRDGDDYVLECRDDGPGVRQEVDIGSGLGMRIMQAAAQQLGGTLEFENADPGQKLVLRWPYRRA